MRHMRPSPFIRSSARAARAAVSPSTSGQIRALTGLRRLGLGKGELGTPRDPQALSAARRKRSQLSQRHFLDPVACALS